MKKYTRKKRVEKEIRRIREQYGIAGPGTEADFFRICASEGITVYEHDVPSSFLVSIRGYKSIVLDRSLIGVKRLVAMWHEVGHALMKHEGNAFFEGGPRDHQEREAKHFSDLMMEVQHA